MVEGCGIGANDGIISISSLAVGVAAANSSREAVILATVAGLVAGALSMAAGEYVSVSSQTDIENADIEREKQELKEQPISNERKAVLQPLTDFIQSKVAKNQEIRINFICRHSDLRFSK